MTYATIRGSAFMASLPAGGDLASIEAREELVLDAVRRGTALPISWVPIHVELAGHKGVVHVASDTLRFGVPGDNADPNDWDWVRIAVTPITAQQIADQLGVLLPTDKILDLAYAQADVRLRAHIQSPVTATVLGMLAHHVAIEAERAGREGLISTIGKDWILGNEMSPSPWGGPPAHPFGFDGAINYGWHVEPTPAILARTAWHRAHPEDPYGGPFEARPGIVVWQTRGLRHDRHHVDYSQWVPRLVAARMEVDGKRVSTAEVMQSPELAGLVSYEGPLRSVRLPDPPGRSPSGGGENRSTSRAPGPPSAGVPEAGSVDAANDPDSRIRQAQAAFTAFIHRRDPSYRAWLNGIGITLAGLRRLLRGRHTSEDVNALAANAENALCVGYLPGKMPEILVPFAEGKRFQGFVVEVEETPMACPQGGESRGLDDTGAPESAFNDINLGSHTLRFANGFPDATFFGVHFSGLCGGMSYTTLDLWNAGRPAPTTTRIPSTKQGLGAYIKARQVDSLLDWHAGRFAMMLANPVDASLAQQTAASFDELRRAIDAGKPVVIGLIPAPWNPLAVTAAHQVVAHGYAASGGARTVLIWDSNRPLVHGLYLHQAPGELHWTEPALGGPEKKYRGWFVESGYTPKEPPATDERLAVNDAGTPDGPPFPLASGPCDPFAVYPDSGDAGDAQADQALSTAMKGAGVGAAVGTALEAVPVAGPFLHAAAIVAGAIGGAIAGATEDTFMRGSPPAIGLGLAVAIHVLPNLLFSGIDTITVHTGNREHPAEEHAARLMRYLNLQGQVVANPAGTLYNPNDFGRHDNPYMESVDPKFPMTDPRYTRRIKWAVERRHALPPDARTPEQAKALLAALRATIGPSKLLDWSQVRDHLPELRRNVAHLRALAGESGPDAVLGAALRGDVSPKFTFPIAHARPASHGRPLRLASTAGRPLVLRRTPAPPPPPRRETMSHVAYADPFANLVPLAPVGETGNSPDLGPPAPGTWTYFRFTPHLGMRRVTIISGIRDVERADATVRADWSDFPAPITVYREPADGSGGPVVVFTNRTWTYTRWVPDGGVSIAITALHHERERAAGRLLPWTEEETKALRASGSTVASGVQDNDVERTDRRIRDAERAKGERGVTVIRSPSDDELESVVVWDQEGKLPPAFYGMAPTGHGRTETAGAGETGEVTTTVVEATSVYDRPDEDAAVVGEIVPGDPIVQIDANEGWSYVSFGAPAAPSAGWVPSETLAEPEVNDDLRVEDFEAPLARYGTWIDDPEHGRFWQPAPDVAGEDFVPYASDGTWVATDNGQWIFRSRWDDGFGWAVYHYGRWFDHPRFGWVWRPGTEWAPAWVEWRHGGGHVGWVPLGPPGYVVPERHWVFLEERRFGDPGGVWRWRVPRERLHEVFVRAQPLARRSGVAWAPGPAMAVLRTAGRPVQTVRVSVPSARAIRAQASKAVAAAVVAGRPVPHPGVLPVAVVKHGPGAGTAVPVSSRPPAPARPAGTVPSHPSWTVPLPLQAPRGGAQPKPHPDWQVPHPLPFPTRPQEGSPLAPPGALPRPPPVHPGPAGPLPGAAGQPPPAPRLPPRAGPSPVNRQSSRGHGKDAGAPPEAHPDLPSAFENGSIVSLWVPGLGRWEDVARTKPGLKGAALARDLGTFLVERYFFTGANEPAFGVVVNRGPTSRGTLLIAKPPRGEVRAEWFTTSEDPHWPRWAVASRKGPPPRAGGFLGDADLFTDGPLISLLDRVSGNWDDFVEVVRPRINDLGIDQAIAGYLVREAARRSGQEELGRWEKRDPRSWRGVYLLACRPGQALRIEGFPMGTSPTWARLLSAPEAGGPETGDVFWPFNTPGWRLVRKEQRQWLRDKGLSGVLPGLHLDEPDEAPSAPQPAPVVLVPEPPPPAQPPAPAAKPRSKPARPAGSGSPALRPGLQILEPEASGIDASDPFVGLDAGAEEPEDPPALRTLLSQLDRRFPYRWRGGADGLTRAQNGVSMLWVTDDKGRIGANRTGPDLEALKRCVRADARAERADWVSDPDGVRYLAVIVRSDRAKSQDPSAWDLSGLDGPARRAS